MLSLTTLAVVIAVIIAVVVALAATKPDHFRITRSTTIKASPAEIYAVISDFHHWGQWSPYDERDPAMTKTYGGAPRGPGAIYAWDGNKQVGKGRIEIIGEEPPHKVFLRLQIERPFACDNRVEYALVEKGAETEMSWSLEGPSNLMSKIMGLFMNMDAMVGKDFEKGLAKLKAHLEG